MDSQSRNLQEQSGVFGTMKARQKEDEELSSEEMKLKKDVEKLAKELKEKSERLVSQEEQVSCLKSEADTLNAKHANNRVLLDCSQSCISALKMESERLKQRDDEEKAKLDSFRRKCDSDISKMRGKLEEYVAAFKMLPNVAEFGSYQQEVMDLEAQLKQTRSLVEKQKQALRRLYIDADVIIRSGCELAELHKEISIKISAIRQMHAKLRELKAIRHDRDAQLAAARQRRLQALVNRAREDFPSCGEQNDMQARGNGNRRMDISELEPKSPKRVANQLIEMDAGSECGKATENSTEIEEPAKGNFDSECPINVGLLESSGANEQEPSSQKARDENFQGVLSVNIGDSTSENERSPVSADIVLECAEVATPKKPITKSVHFSTPEYLEFVKHSAPMSSNAVRDAPPPRMKPSQPEPMELCCSADRDNTRNLNPPTFINFNEFLKQNALNNKSFRPLSATTAPKSIMKMPKAGEPTNTAPSAGSINLPSFNGNTFFPSFRLGNTSS